MNSDNDEQVRIELYIENAIREAVPGWKITRWMDNGSHDKSRYAATWIFTDDTTKSCVRHNFRISLTTDFYHAIIFHGNSDGGALGIHHFIETGSVIPLCDLELPWRVPVVPKHWRYSLAECIGHVVKNRKPNVYGLS